MKTLTLRISETDYKLLHAVATSERMSMTAYLLRLFDKHGVPPAFKTTAPISQPKPKADDTPAELADIDWESLDSPD